MSIVIDYLLVGWQEWCILPELNIPAIKAKIDTGARTSAIHATQIEAFKKDNQDFVRFCVSPVPYHPEIIRHCEAPIVDQRMVMSSSGHQEERFVIETVIQLSQQCWKIELTLSNREPLRFRMLLGRAALAGHAVIDPKRCLLQGKISGAKLKRTYLG